MTSSGDVIFDREEINPGGYYNKQTGIYTVPCDGIYQFHASATYKFMLMAVMLDLMLITGIMRTTDQPLCFYI